MIRYFVLGLLVLLPFAPAFTGNDLMIGLGSQPDGQGPAASSAPTVDDQPTMKLGPNADGHG